MINGGLVCHSPFQIFENVSNFSQPSPIEYGILLGSQRVSRWNK